MLRIQSAGGRNSLKFNLPKGGQHAPYCPTPHHIFFNWNLKTKWFLFIFKGGQYPPYCHFLLVQYSIKKFRIKRGQYHPRYPVITCYNFLISFSLPLGRHFNQWYFGKIQVSGFRDFLIVYYVYLLVAKVRCFHKWFVLYAFCETWCFMKLLFVFKPNFWTVLVKTKGK